MNVGLIDVDGHNFPNLALMKLSSYHKNKGDSVDWWNGFQHYDRVYMSKVFTFSPDEEHCIDADEIIKGGTGYKIYEDLPEEIENTFPDYSIYPKFDFAVGFLTRGCIRNCPWCIVPKKEGKIRAAFDWKSIKRSDSRNIMFLDNNVLASDWGISQMEDMVGKDVRIDFNQAMDARLVTDDIAKLLSKLKWIRYIRFSCDTQAMIPIVYSTVEKLKQYDVVPSRVFVYALIQDVEEAHNRIRCLDSMGVTAFAQPYMDFDGGKPTLQQRQLARWCNMQAVHKSMTFEEYKRNKHYETQI